MWTTKPTAIHGYLKPLQVPFCISWSDILRSEANMMSLFHQLHKSILALEKHKALHQNSPMIFFGVFVPSGCKNTFYHSGLICSMIFHHSLQSAWSSTRGESNNHHTLCLRLCLWLEVKSAVAVEWFCKHDLLMRNQAKLLSFKHIPCLWCPVFSCNKIWIIG